MNRFLLLLAASAAVSSALASFRYDIPADLVSGVATRQTSLKAKAAAEVDYSAQALRVVTAMKDSLGIDVSVSGIRVISETKDLAGNRHVRFEQLHRGIPVWGRQLIVHLGADGVAYELNGSILEGLAMAVTPKVPAPTGAELVIYAGANANVADARLAWTYVKGKHRRFVDALTGRKLGSILVCHGGETDDSDDDDDLPEKYFEVVADYMRTVPFPAGTNVTITGKMPWQTGGEVRSLTATLAEDGRYYLCGTTADGVEWAVYEGLVSNLDAFTNGTPAIVSSDSADWSFSDTDITIATGVLRDGFAVAGEMVDVLDCYRSLGRRSYDGKGGRLCAAVYMDETLSGAENPTGYDNCAWTEDGFFLMGYCVDVMDGKLATSECAFDVVAHEITHAVTDCSSKLCYFGESGALNESFSDVMGASFEFFTQGDGRAAYPSSVPSRADWLIGEDSNPGRIFRDFIDPGREGQPSAWHGVKWRNVASDDDEGGVHDNSGVQNHMFYLMVEKYGVNITNAALIAYQTLVNHCTPMTGYAPGDGCPEGEIASLWVSAANELTNIVSVSDIQGVGAAWAEVMDNNFSYDSAYAHQYVGAGYIEGADGRPFQCDGVVKTGAVGKDGLVTVSVTLKGGPVRLSISGKVDISKGTATLTKRDGSKVTLVFLPDEDGITSVQVGYYGSAFSPLESEDEDEDDDNFCVGVDCVRDEPKPTGYSNLGNAFTNLYVGVQQDVDVSAEVAATYDITYAAKNLPKGMKLVAKSRMITGVPTTAGDGTATLTYKGVKHGSTTLTYPWHVTALPAWAQGNFSGTLRNDEGEIVGTATFAVSKVGKISGKVVTQGKTWSGSANGYRLHRDDADFYVVFLDVKNGRVTSSLMGDATNLIAGVISGAVGGNTFACSRNVWKDAENKTVGALIAKLPVRTFTHEECAGIPEGDVITVKFSAGGKATCTLVTASGYKASVSSVLSPIAENSYEADVYFPINVRKDFNGLGVTLSFIDLIVQ